MNLLKLPKCRLSYAKIVQTERNELAQIAEVPPILCKDMDFFPIMAVRVHF